MSSIHNTPSLRRNTAALFVLQIANYLLPLVTLPWLTRVLDINGFGRLGFALAVISYFVLVADYGFNYSATREVAVQRDNRQRVAQIFWATMHIKSVAAVLGFAVLLVACYGFNLLIQERLLLLLGYLAVVGSVLTPTWYFQGKEQVITLSIITVVTKALSVPLIIMLVREPGDIHLAMVIMSGATLLNGVLAFAEVCRREGFFYVTTTWGEMRAALIAGWHSFLATAVISVYLTANAILLGIFSGYVALGQYVAAEKIIRGIQGIMTPVAVAAYPRAGFLLSSGSPAYGVFFRKILVLQLGLGMAVTVPLLFFADEIMTLVFGPQFSTAGIDLSIMAVIPLVVGIGNVFANQYVLARGDSRRHFRIVALACVFYVLTAPWLIIWLSDVGAAVVAVLVEIVVLVLATTVALRTGLLEVLRRHL